MTLASTLPPLPAAEPGPGDLVAIDPGIDELGWARFAPLPMGTIHPHLIARAYRGSGIVRLRTTELPLAARLIKLADALREIVCSEPRPARVVIEQPARTGTYKRHLKGQRTQQAQVDMTLLYYASGALVLAAHDLAFPVELRNVGGKSKLERLQIIGSYWPKFRSKLVTRGKNAGNPAPDDETDAVYLGMTAAVSPSRAVPP